MTTAKADITAPRPSFLEVIAEGDGTGGNTGPGLLVRQHLSHFARLPAEIMTTIFSTVQAFERVEKEELDNRFNLAGDKLGWIQLTHVCRHWRNLALASRSLWAEIDFDRKELWVDELIRRAGPSVLLSIYVSRSPTPSQSRLVQHNLHRLKFLRIERGLVFDDSHRYVSLVDSLIRPAPHLETFEFYDYDPDTRYILYPDDFLGNDTPRLRRFVAENFGPTPWTLPHLCNLIFLSIEFSPLSRTRLPEMRLEDILSALERMPALQELQLLSSLPESPPRAHGSKITPLRTVALGSLCRLSIVGSTACCIYLLHHLDMPMTTAISLTMECSDHSALVVGQFFDDFSSWLGARHRFEPFAAKVTKTDRGYGSFDMTAEAWRGRGANEDADVRVTFTWESDNLMVGELPLAKACYGLFASPKLQRLCVDVAQWNTGCWEELVFRCPMLEHLATADTFMSRLIRCTSEPHWDRLRALKTIELIVKQPTRDQLNYMARLKTWLAMRAFRGIPLQQLIFKTHDTAADGWVAEIQAAAVPGLRVHVENPSHQP
ncbi:hypothetical protein FA95DRAFT_108659 [Auriscalpium vulgare]|uniref:Uncharacterized protein n=1 Tax=Auriscalpium vulgare TaxID=40419 RepID=A0ACB8S6L3_9AGAM|nr:hypothetical protein FA95DRAFT_108659 [Auriscalpium vulgare]